MRQITSVRWTRKREQVVAQKLDIDWYLASALIYKPTKAIGLREDIIPNCNTLDQTSFNQTEPASARCSKRTKIHIVFTQPRSLRVARRHLDLALLLFSSYLLQDLSPCPQGSTSPSG